MRSTACSTCGLYRVRALSSMPSGPLATVLLPLRCCACLTEHRRGECVERARPLLREPVLIHGLRDRSARVAEVMATRNSSPQSWHAVSPARWRRARQAANSYSAEADARSPSVARRSADQRIVGSNRYLLTEKRSDFRRDHIRDDSDRECNDKSASDPLPPSGKKYKKCHCA